jgi:hypothetical protein
MTDDLESVAAALVARGKGILAADPERICESFIRVFGQPPRALRSLASRRDGRITASAMTPERANLISE